MHEWISKELKDQIKEREKLYINSVKHPTEVNVKIYKKFLNKVLSNQRRAAKNYYHEQFEIRGPNTKSGWAFINFLTGQRDLTRSLLTMLVLIRLTKRTHYIH